MLEQEFEYYKKNQEKLVKKYNGKYIAIVGKKVIGVFDNELEAYTHAKEQHPVGTFLIQYCSPGKENYTQTYYSRVAFGN